ncbi:UNVERIFIED_CONTAM: hypothetical protein Slati_4325900 [Sesamum latifolium]|uniref:Uncharacterized protein n=1 Tax=Sesamum latifolium TaxID=2727402 RepID=A0AAW2SMV4_9LAMI
MVVTGSVWWEKLSRNFVPVQCTKLIFVPPWEGFSPNSTRSSIMASVLRDDGAWQFTAGQQALSENGQVETFDPQSLTSPIGLLVVG